MSLEKMIHRHYFTYSTLLDTIDYWDLPNKIAQNYSSWYFKHPLPELTTDWLCLVKHSLIYYLLKNIQWCFSDVQSHWVVSHSHSMKKAYSKMLLSSFNDFDLKLLILIRAITFFINKTIHQILIDFQLQNDIYQLIVHNLLGIPVQTQAYRLLLKIYKTTPLVKNQKKSTFRKTQDWDLMLDFSSNQQTKNKNLQVPTRRNAKRQSADKIIQITQVHSNVQQMKSVLKENLYVKPIVRASTPKFNIHELRRIENQSVDERNLRHTMVQKQNRNDFNRKRQAIMSNQLSNAFQFNSSLKLKDIKTFPIQRSKPRLQPIRKSFQAKMKTTQQAEQQIKQDENKSNIQTKNGLKSSKNWPEIVSNMKNQLYTVKDKKPKGFSNYDDIDITKNQSNQSYNLKQRTTNVIAKAENAKFRKLDLLNSRNIQILQEKMAESQEEVDPQMKKNYSLFAFQQQIPFDTIKFQQKKKTTKLKLRNSKLDFLNKD